MHQLREDGYGVYYNIQLIFDLLPIFGMFRDKEVSERKKFSLRYVTLFKTRTLKYFSITRTDFQSAIQTSLDVAVIRFYLPKTIVYFSLYPTTGINLFRFDKCFMPAGMKLAVVAQRDQ